ncbi:hypothetical protein [Aliihoeflea sp. PC F10.4]
MADWSPIYSTGTASVVASGTDAQRKTVTGNGTNWLSAGLRTGDQFKIAGRTVSIASVVSNTSLLLTEQWPDTARANVYYEILRVSDADRLIAAHADLMAALVPNLTAFGDLEGAANKLPYFAAAGMALTDLTAKGRDIIAKANNAEVQEAIGGGAAGRSVFTAGTQAAAQEALGGGAGGRSLFGAVDIFAALAMITAGTRLGTTSISPPDNDLNKAVDAGFYHIVPATLNTPPGMSYGTVLVIRVGQIVTQIVTLGVNGQPNLIVVRGSNTTGATWSSFSPLLPEIIQNPNGVAVRLGGVVQLCWRANFQLSYLSNAIYQNQWTFPASFASEPAKLGVVSEWNPWPTGAPGFIAMRASSGVSCQVQMWSSGMASGAALAGVTCFAMGLL